MSDEQKPAPDVAWLADMVEIARCHAIRLKNEVRLKEAKSVQKYADAILAAGRYAEATEYRLLEAERQRDEALNALYKARHSMRYAIEAIQTGRSEPLFIARDNLKNTLDDMSRLASKGDAE